MRSFSETLESIKLLEEKKMLSSDEEQSLISLRHSHKNMAEEIARKFRLYQKTKTKKKAKNLTA
jgi:tryptophanyl-tRNA synthetase